VVERSEDQIKITFKTAWSSPTPVVVKMVRTFPELEYYIHTEEESGKFCIDIAIKDGKIKAYDSPRYVYFDCHNKDLNEGENIVRIGNKKFVLPRAGLRLKLTIREPED